MNKGYKMVAGLVIGIGVAGCLFISKKVYEKRQVEVVEIEEV